MFNFKYILESSCSEEQLMCSLLFPVQDLQNDKFNYSANWSNFDFLYLIDQNVIGEDNREIGSLNLRII